MKTSQILSSLEAMRAGIGPWTRHAAKYALRGRELLGFDLDFDLDFGFRDRELALELFERRGRDYIHASE